MRLLTYRQATSVRFRVFLASGGCESAIGASAFDVTTTRA
jgi:hypothetical protein